MAFGLHLGDATSIRPTESGIIAHCRKRLLQNGHFGDRLYRRRSLFLQISCRITYAATADFFRLQKILYRHLIVVSGTRYALQSKNFQEIIDNKEQAIEAVKSAVFAAANQISADLASENSAARKK